MALQFMLQWKKQIFPITWKTNVINTQNFAGVQKDNHNKKITLHTWKGILNAY